MGFCHIAQGMAALSVKKSSLVVLDVWTTQDLTELLGQGGQEKNIKEMLFN